MNHTHNDAHNPKKNFLCIFLPLILLMSMSSQVLALSFSWNYPVVPDAEGDVGEYTSMKVVNGMPAISYYDNANGDLKFVRATNASGSAWGTPLTLDSTGNVGSYTSLAVINGVPAISYRDNTNDSLKFIRATDASGSAWGAPQTLDSTAGSGQNPSLAEVNGMPAISYGDSNSLKFIRAADTNGTTWNAPLVLDSGSLSMIGLDFTRNSRPMFTTYSRPMFTTHSRPVFTTVVKSLQGKESRERKGNGAETREYHPRNHIPNQTRGK